MINNYRVSRDFVNYSDSDLDEFANNISQSLDKNPSFPAPPVLAADLATLVATFRDAIAAASGDPQDTVAKDKARDGVLDALRKDANYVQTVASHDMEMLLSSGYLPASTNRASAPLDQPVIVTLDNAGVTKLLLRLTPVLNARSYQVQTNTNGNGTWQEAGIFTQARRITLDGLTSGTTYSVRARAVGGTTGYSEWCIPASHMAT
jgi:hypothetical protein